MLNKLHYFITRKPVLALLLFALTERILIFAIYSHITIFPDSEGYIDLASRLLHFNLSGYQGERSPGYPALLFLAGNIQPLAVIYQICIGFLTAFYLYKTLLLLNFTKNSSIYITLLLNSLLHVAFYEFAILTEAVTLFFITLCFYFIFKLFSGQTGWKHIFSLSIITGLLIIIKPFYIFLPFLIYGLYTLKNFRFRRIINRQVFIIFFPLISFLGWSYVNKVNTGYFVSTSYYGINIAQNCVYFAENTTPQYKAIGEIYARHREEALRTNKDVAMSIWFAREELLQATGLSQTDLSHELSNYSNVTIKLNPWAYAKQVFISWKDFWKTAMYWNYDDFNFKYANKAALLVWLIESFILQIFKIVFVLLIPWHIALFFKNRKINVPLIITTLVFAASVLQAMVTYGTNSRFSYPFELLIIISVLLTFDNYLGLTKKTKQTTQVGT